MRFSNKDIVILIQPDTEIPYKIVFLPFGPLFLATKLKKSGFKVVIFDERIDRRSKLAEPIKQQSHLCWHINIHRT